MTGTIAGPSKPPTGSRTVVYLDIASLCRDDNLQTRVELDRTVAREYAEQIRAGAVFPPVLVFQEGRTLWLVDGHHRTAARELAGFTTVLAEVRHGTCEDAIWAGCAANKAHGLRRSNADKRRAVAKALLHPRARRLSDRQIAQHCGVHHHSVGRIRRSLEQAGSISEVYEREVTRGQLSYQQHIAGIRAANTRRKNTSRMPGQAQGAQVELFEQLAPREAVIGLVEVLFEASDRLAKAAKLAVAFSVPHSVALEDVRNRIFEIGGRVTTSWSEIGPRGPRPPSA